MNNRLSLLSLCTVLLLNPVLISKCYAKNADESTDKLSIEVKRAIDENTIGIIINWRQLINNCPNI